MKGERSMVPREKPRTYYDRPVVKKPVWTWEIPTYFFTGGMAGAATALAYAAQLAGNKRLARRSWLVAAVGVSASPPLLISDLGRPERFLNMMRVLKVTSPMSVGSWILATNGGVVSAAALAAFLPHPPKIMRAAAPGAALAGPALTTYTAVLISNSAIPAWSEARRHLPFVFAGSGAASAGAAAWLLSGGIEAAPARRFAIGGAVAELAAGQAMERSLGEVGEPYSRGRAGTLMKAAKALTAGGAALMVIGRRRRGVAAAGAGMLIAGSLAERWGIYSAGFASAQNPDYTVGPQRERLNSRA